VPVTRVQPNSLDVLHDAIEALELDGNEVVQFYEYAGEWFIVHRSAPPKPRGKIIERRVDP
jgi:hypothetical protein